MKTASFQLFLFTCVLILVSCGKKSDGGDNTATGDSTQETTATATTAGDSGDSRYIHYDNAKYGFSVDVPHQMVCTDEPQMAEGANFALSADDVMNLLSLFASDNYGGKPFTADDIRGELDERAASLGSEAGATIDKKEEADGWTLTISGGEMNHQVYRARYKDGKRFELSYIYSKEQEAALGGDVERHVMESWKIK